MNWIFWTLLVLALVLLFAPLFGMVPAALKATLWIIGALLMVASIIWAISLFTRAVPGPAML